MDDDKKTVLFDLFGIYSRVRAPEGKFRLVMVDTWEAPFSSDIDLGVYDTLEDAIRAGIEAYRRNASSGGIDFLKFYIYDHEAKWLGEIVNGRFSTKK